MNRKIDFIHDKKNYLFAFKNISPFIIEIKFALMQLRCIIKEAHVCKTQDSFELNETNRKIFCTLVKECPSYSILDEKYFKSLNLDYKDFINNNSRIIKKILLKGR